MQNGLNFQRIKMLGVLLQTSIISSDLCIMTSIHFSQFNSRETWMLYIVICWCTTSFLGVLMNLAIKGMLLSQVASTIMIIYMIEISCDMLSDVRYRAYPLIILFNMIPLITLKKLKDLRNLYLKQLTIKKDE